MFIDPNTLPQTANGLQIVEDVERASLCLVTQAMVSFANEAATIFANEPDDPAEIG